MLKDALIKELQQEGRQTRRMLERVPLEQSSWKPHEKSMSLGRLAGHIAELPDWVKVTLETDELDFGTAGYKAFIPATREELLDKFDQKLAGAIESLQAADNEVFNQPWSLKNNGHVFFTLPKSEVIRSSAMNHVIHHRAQLSVYLRLLDVPVPGMYGPTADERAGVA
jgi:uncharacterized damage-inducible protein DinB